jgi:hypothetical protein
MVRLILLLIAVSILATACSSSSMGKRYGFPEVKEDVSKLHYSRFTSENDSSLYKSEFDEEPVEDHPVNVKKIINKKEEKLSDVKDLSDKEKLMLEIVRYLNTPYLYGGSDNSGIDCSAFTQNVFMKSLGVKLPRRASEQYRSGRKVSSKEKLEEGDLLFFDTTKNSYPGHVGIYIGEDLFAHASFSKGVTISSLQSSYFKKRYVGARRVAVFNK